MHDHSTWRPAYAVLLAPIHWFTSDPATVFRLALGVNAALGAVSAVLLLLLARRLTSLGPWGGAAATLAVSLTPARLFTTDFVWSESLTSAMFLASLLALLRFWSTPSRSSGVVLALAVAGAFGTHSRLLPLVVIAAVAIAIALRRRSLSVGDAAVVGATAAAGIVAVGLATRAVVQRLWREPAATNSFAAVAERLLDPGALIVAFAGQTWYQLAASAGLVGVGGWVLARNSFATAPGTPSRDDSRLVGLSVLTCIGVSIVFMAGRVRADQVVYGRYSDVVTAPVLLIGLATIAAAATSTPVRARVTAAAGIAIATITAAAVTLAFRHDVLSSSNGLEPMILGLQPFRGDGDEVDLVRITALALLVGAALLATTFTGRPTGRSPAPTGTFLVTLVVALLAVGGIRTAHILRDEWPDRNGHEAVADLARSELPPGTPIDFHLPAASDATDRLMLYQMYLPQSEFTVVEDSSDVVSSPMVFARPDDRELIDGGATLVWTDRFGRMSLWDRSARG